MSYVHHSILVVDNDADQARFTELALQRVGVISPVQVVHDAAEAIRYLCGRDRYQDRESYPLPKLVLADWKLPDLSGAEFLTWLRREPVLKRVPVIILAQPSHTADLNLAYELGCNSFLIKPPSFNTLLVIMQGLVQYWLALNTAPELCATADVAHVPRQGQALEQGSGTP